MIIAAHIAPAWTMADLSSLDQSTDVIRKLTTTSILRLQGLPNEIKLRILQDILHDQHLDEDQRNDINVLFLDKAWYRMLAPEYYRTRLFKIASSRSLLNRCLKEASTTCLSNIVHLRITEKYELNRLDWIDIIAGDMAEIVNDIDKAGDLQRLSRIDIVIWQRRFYRPIPPVAMRRLSRLGSEEGSQWWTDLHAQIGFMPATIAAETAKLLPKWTVDVCHVLRIVSVDDVRQSVPIDRNGRFPLEAVSACHEKSMLTFSRNENT